MLASEISILPQTNTGGDTHEDLGGEEQPTHC